MVKLPLIATAVAAGAATAVVAGSAVGSAPRLTSTASPNPAVAGDAVTISGRLSGGIKAARPVVLWRRAAGERRFKRAGATLTDSRGAYRFARAPGVVDTNRAWYVTSGAARSRTIRELVRAAVTLDAGADRLTVHVTPDHRGDVVTFQRRRGHRWMRFGRARLGADSSATLHRHVPSGAMFRAVLRGDRRNATGASATVSVGGTGGGDGIHKIKHVVIIMQENRSFDSYFGTYPGADGIPPGVCVPDPAKGGCVTPYHDTADLNHGGPHDANAFTSDLAGGAMNGFVGTAERASGCTLPNQPNCQNGAIDVMGYHDQREIPNYWAYARGFVLQDRMFEPNASWSLPQHLFQVSGWSASCAIADDPMSCTNALNNPARPPQTPLGAPPNYAWTDLTYLLHRAGVSWGYYVFSGTEPDCANDAAITCAQKTQNARTPGIWNPLPYFTTVRQDGQLGNIQSLTNFYGAAANGTLPAVSWIDPSGKVSEHPPALVSAGQTYVTGLINAIMRGPDWSSTAIFVSWDDWGGFYDHVTPPVVDQNGYGFRVPGLVISPYAKEGLIDHQTLSHDAYLKFIEDDFLGGARIDPHTDGRPDRRPAVRENASGLGNLIADFDFAQRPRAPMLLPLHPPLS